MGCDIHLYGEKKIEGVWTALDTFKEDKDGYYDIDDWENEAYSGRNYTLFGILAGVRKDDIQQFETKGFPKDSSLELKRLSDQWEGGGHSHSYLNLKELLSLQDKKITIAGMKDKEELLSLINELKKDSPDYSKLYPYCAWSSQNNYESFSVEIPLSYMINDFTKDIKEYFINNIGLSGKPIEYKGDDLDLELKNNKLDPEDFRIVFWFDN